MNELKLYNDGQSEFLIKNSPNGEVRNLTTTVVLDPDTDVYQMSVKRGDRWQKVNVLTAMGYANLNKYLGISFVSATSLLNDEGNAVCNPYFKYDSDGDIEYVKVRLIGIGRNHIGNLVAIDYTLRYDLKMYLAQDVMARWSGRAGDATKSWGELFSTPNVPDDIKKDPKKKLVHVPGGLTLALDITSKDVIGLIQEHSSRQKFAERNASTICRRNILKSLTGKSVVPDNLEVKVSCWPTRDRKLTELAKVVEDAKDGRCESDGEVVEVSAVSEVISDPDEVNAAVSGDFDEEMVADAEYTPIVQQDPEDYRKLLRSYYRRMKNPEQQAKALKVLKDNGLSGPADIKELADVKLLHTLECEFAAIVGAE